MRIIVLMKVVPDTYGDRRLCSETGLTDRSTDEQILDEIGERALEVALSHADAAPGTEVTVISVSPEPSATVLRKALAMGADAVVQVSDERLRGADLPATAEAIAAAVERVGFDLIVAGNASTDGAGGVVPAMVSELLGIPLLSNLISVQITDGLVSGTRSAGDESMRTTAELPAILSVTEAMPDARFPNFKAIMAAKKKPFDTVTSGDLGIDPQDLTVGRSILLGVAQRPPREAGITLIDDGTAADQLADFLVKNRLV